MAAATGGWGVGEGEEDEEGQMHGEEGDGSLGGEHTMGHAGVLL